MAGRPKLRDLSDEERYEAYLQIEYRKALDELARANGIGGRGMELISGLCGWKRMYVGFLTRILREHVCLYGFPDLVVLKAQMEECGVECTSACERMYTAFLSSEQDNCLSFTIDGTQFTLFHDKFSHHLALEDGFFYVEKRFLRMPTETLIGCIRLTVPYIPRIKEMAAEAKRQVPVVAMVRKIKKIAKAKTGTQDSSKTGV